MIKMCDKSLVYPLKLIFKASFQECVFPDCWKKAMLCHGTIIRTGITCKKIPCYMRNSACRWLIVENAKIFRSYVKHF